GPVTVSARARGLIVMLAVLDAFDPLASVSVALTTYVPFTLKVVVKLVPVPVAGLPPVAVQANVYGAVPPVAEAVKVTAVPTVPVVGTVIRAARATDGVILIVAVAVAVFAFASVIVTDAVFAPFVLWVVLKLAPVPVA